MKSLSLKQPYAELILQGKKKIELRKWNTKFRGEFLIHASKNPDETAMKKFDFSNLPLGYIIGKAELVDVIDYSKNKNRFIEDKNLHLADESWGSFGFVLKNPEKIKPIKFRGSLGFWEFEGDIKKCI